MLRQRNFDCDALHHDMLSFAWQLQEYIRRHGENLTFLRTMKVTLVSGCIPYARRSNADWPRFSFFPMRTKGDDLFVCSFITILQSSMYVGHAIYRSISLLYSSCDTTQAWPMGSIGQGALRR